jgi:hypothetical protein
MASKFGHEHLNRREKAWKEPSGCGTSKEQPSIVEWSPEGGLRLTRDAFEGRNERLFRKDLMEYFTSQKRWRAKTFTVIFPPNFGTPYKFAFGMDAKTFSQANRLEMKRAMDLFFQVKSRVEAMLPILKEYQRDDYGDIELNFSCDLFELKRVFHF